MYGNLLKNRLAGYVQQPDPWTAKMKGEYSKYCDLQKKHLASQGTYKAEFKKQEGLVLQFRLEMPYPEMKISADGHAALVQPATNSMIDGRMCVVQNE